MTSSHADAPNYLLQTLMPLRFGQTVKFVQVREYRHGAGQIKREDKLGILFAPGVLYGLSPEAVVVSMIDKGSCVVFPKRGDGRAKLIKAGISPNLVNGLLEALAQVYGDSHVEPTKQPFQ